MISLLFTAFGVIGSCIWAVAAQASPNGPASTAEESSPQFTNRLISSGNPYLLLHAHNPVDWYPWGPEALETARREDKPIFLSVGYSTCFWCHVAERTIYSNPEIARLMNEWFINVKVDRERRPDVDQIYMLATRIMTGHGGWPNNVFLTPDLQPFFGGSYFPPADDPIRGAGFPTILRALHEAWTKERAKVTQAAADVSNAMRRVQMQMMSVSSAQVAPAAWLRTARETLTSQLDSEHGGIGVAEGGPRFPRSPDLALLMADFRINRHEAARSAVMKTLDAMVYGGVHDHLAGGFHRYSTEPTWSIPHFEKMLYDNAQLLQLLAEAFELTRSPLYRQAALETAGYLSREMTAPSAAGFFTAQDAQVEGVEGASYVWTRREIASVLGERSARRFFQVYELTPLSEETAPGVASLQSRDGERPGVLRIRLPIDRTLKETGFGDAAALIGSLRTERAKLLAARDRRRQPARDEKILTGFNGLAITAFAVAGRALNEPKFTTLARTVADRIWALAYEPRTRSLKHEIFGGRAHTDGFLQDYAHLGRAFMSLASATANTAWRDRAAMLATDILDRFMREDGSLAMTAEQKDLLIPAIDEGDSDAPSGTSAAIDLLLQLAAVPKADSRFGPAAMQAVNRLSGTFQQYPAVWATAITALNVHSLPQSIEPASPAVATAVPETDRSGFRVPVTADHVRVSAMRDTDAAADRIVVTVAVEKGYHINANPASFEYLIPTSLKFHQLKPSKVVYPKPVRFKTAFAPEDLDVYEGTVQVIASFPRGVLMRQGALRGVVTAQACDVQICLPPSDLPFSVEPEDR